MSTSTRIQQFRPSQISQENRSKKRVGRTRDKSNPRRVLGDITGDISNAVTTPKPEFTGVTKPDRKKKSHKEKVDISSEKEYMPVSGFKNTEFTAEFCPSPYFNNLIEAIKNTSVLPEIPEPKSVDLPSFIVDMGTRPVTEPDPVYIDFQSPDLPPVDLPDISDLQI